MYILVHFHWVDNARVYLKNTTFQIQFQFQNEIDNYQVHLQPEYVGGFKQNWMNILLQHRLFELNTLSYSNLNCLTAE